MSELGWQIVLNLVEFAGLLASVVVMLWISPIRLAQMTADQPGSRNRLTVKRGMVWVAWAGLAMGTVCWFRVNFGTIYAPGYDEGHFNRVRVGMTRAEVESVAGKPLRSDATSPRWSLCENWIYSDPSPPGRISDNYWRRWVMFDRGTDGKVIAIVSDYYED